jgi:hypothetical protein
MFAGIAHLWCVVNWLLHDHMLIISADRHCNKDITFSHLGRHNFFIFPRKELSSDCSSHEFLCQTTSIDFLAKYQFDFNTCFREGASICLKYLF